MHIFIRKYISLYSIILCIVPIIVCPEILTALFMQSGSREKYFFNTPKFGDRSAAKVLKIYDCEGATVLPIGVDCICRTKADLDELRRKPTDERKRCGFIDQINKVNGISHKNFIVFSTVRPRCVAQLRKPLNHDSNNSSSLIISEDIESPPGILKELEDEECQEFTMEMWKRGASLKEAIGRINTLQPLEDESVMDNFMYGNGSLPENERDYEHYSNEDGVKAKENSNNTPKAILASSIDNLHSHDANPPGIVLGPEYLESSEDECESDPYASFESDVEDEIDNDVDAFSTVNFSALSDAELHVIRYLMTEVKRAENLHTENELLKRIIEDTEINCSVEDRLKYYRRFSHTSNILLSLNANVGCDPLDIDWIPHIERKIRQHIRTKSLSVEKITWTDDAVLVTLKDTKNLSEEALSSAQDSLHAYIQSIGISNGLHGLENIGILLTGVRK